LRLNLEEIYIEKNRNGVSNISLLKSVRPEKKTAVPAQPKRATPFYLDSLELTAHHVTYVDYSEQTGMIRKGIQGVVPAEIARKRFSVDLNIEKQVFTGINKPDAVVHLILMKVLYGKALGNLKEFGVDPSELVNTFKLQDTLKSVKTSGQEVFQQTTGLFVRETKDAFKGAEGQVTGLFGKFLKPESASREETANKTPSS